jgi:hypothetical protein
MFYFFIRTRIIRISVSIADNVRVYVSPSVTKKKKKKKMIMDNSRRVRDGERTRKFAMSPSAMVSMRPSKRTLYEVFLFFFPRGITATTAFHLQYFIVGYMRTRARCARVRYCEEKDVRRTKRWKTTINWSFSPVTYSYVRACTRRIRMIGRNQYIYIYIWNKIMFVFRVAKMCTVFIAK